MAVLWAGSDLSHGLIACIALILGVEEQSAKAEKASPVILNDILHNQPRLCQPSDQNKEN